MQKTFRLSEIGLSFLAILTLSFGLVACDEAEQKESPKTEKPTEQKPKSAWEEIKSSFAGEAREHHQLVSFAGKLWVIGGEGNDTLNDIWVYVDDGDTWQEVHPTKFIEDNFEDKDKQKSLPPLKKHQVVAYKDTLWVVGTGNWERNTEVWTTTDGKTWTRKADLPQAFRRQAVVFKDNLYLLGMGGYSGNNDILKYNADNDTWQKLETTGDVFTPRNDFGAAVFNNKIWVIGGEDSDKNELTNDVFSSTDGKNWVKETANADFRARRDFAVVATPTKLVLIGGVVKKPAGEHNNRINDIWTSTNGTTWTQEHTEQVIPFGGRYGAQAIWHKNNIYLFGGNGWNKEANNGNGQGESKKDLWKSTGESIGVISK